MLPTLNVKLNVSVNGQHLRYDTQSTSESTWIGQWLTNIICQHINTGPVLVSCRVLVYCPVLSRSSYTRSIDSALSGTMWVISGCVRPKELV